MKDSIDFLPGYAREDLKRIVESVLEKIPTCEMIILYGSYARGTFVEYDERLEFGIPTFFMSDYDLLVITSGINVKEAGKILDDIDREYYKRPRNQVPVQFINEDIKKFNSDLSEGRYFYATIKREGIMLYDSKKYKLERSRKLNYQEIAQQAQEYFNEKFETANDFLRSAMYDKKDEKYKMCSFHLHQACENFFYALNLVHTLDNGKQHNLQKLFRATRNYSPELAAIFSFNKEEDKRLFEILKRAYVEARYNPDFVVTQEDIDALFPKVEKLRDVVSEVCKAQIESYREMK
ncbi:MAG: HEPN domain-containing protein [Barnesiella sp.]